MTHSLFKEEVRGTIRVLVLAACYELHVKMLLCYCVIVFMNHDVMHVCRR